jgi:predicted O-methyltransferase YrrM
MRLTVEGLSNFVNVRAQHASDRVSLRRHPDLAPTLPYDLADARMQLSLEWQEYVARTSVRTHAMSLETAAFLLWLCRQRRPTAVMDLGSGFSSYVLRYYQRQDDESVEVLSVDDSADWIPKTVGFLERHSMPTDGVVPWTAMPDRHFDLVFHDLGGMQLRHEALPRALAAVSDSGVLLCDDTHWPQLNARARSCAAAAERSIHSLRHWTLDDIGRYASVIGPRGQDSNGRRR